MLTLVIFAVVVLASVVSGMLGNAEEFPRRLGRIVVWCLAGFVVFLAWSDVEPALSEYMTLNEIVQEEVQQLNEAKKGPLDNTPEIMELQVRLVQHIKQLEDSKASAEAVAKDPLCRILWKEELERYWATPDYSYSVTAIPELEKDK